MTERAGAAARWHDVALVAAALWGWAATSAYFWHLAKANAVVLPYAPRIVWAVPGELWRLAPAALVLLLFVLPLVFRVLEGRAVISLHAVRPYAMALLALTAVAALLWGRALMRAT